MDHPTDNNPYALLVEEMREHFRVVTEALADVQRNVRYIPEMRQDLHRLRDDVEVIKKVVVEHSHKLKELRGDLRRHEHRITRLEAA